MLKPSRREILSALSVGGGTFLAGCAVGSDESNETTSTADGNTSSTGSTSTADGDNSSTESTQSPPEFPENTSSDACPPFDDADRVVCYDAVDHERMPLVLVPERQMLQPDQPTAFTLRNQSRQQFQTNFYHWQLYKHVDGDWYYILPQSWPVPMTPLGAGENHTWTLTVTTGRVSDGMDSDTAHGTGSLTIAGLGGGDYAFGTDGRFATGSYEGPVALAAGFELTTDPLQLTPTKRKDTFHGHSNKYPSKNGLMPDKFDISPVNWWKKRNWLKWSRLRVPHVSITVIHWLRSEQRDNKKETMDNDYFNKIYDSDFNETPLKHNYSNNECEVQDEARYELTRLREHSEDRFSSRLPTVLSHTHGRLFGTCSFCSVGGCHRTLLTP